MKSGKSAARIGIFAGTFDPVHRGHVAFALAAIKQCQLDKVVFLPERSPRGKLGVSDFAHRYQMVRLAVQPHRKLSVLRLEDAQFTTEHTLPSLLQRYQGSQLMLLLGSDVALTFGFRWPQLGTLLSKTSLIIGLRTGKSRDELQAFLDTLKMPVKVVFIDGPHSQITATDVRNGNLQSIEPSVQHYIQQNQLYQQTASIAV